MEIHKTGQAKVWVLLSGGVDSAACAAFYLAQDFSVEGIYVDHGQPAAAHEKQAARGVARYFEIPLICPSWSGSRELRHGEIAGRNAFLYFAALMEIGSQSGLLASGLHAGTPYFDCSPSFLSSLQKLFDGYCDGRMRLAAPFIEWTKPQVWAYSLAQFVPVELTYSCERGTPTPCGECLSCRDRKALDAVQIVNNTT